MLKNCFKRKNKNYWRLMIQYKLKIGLMISKKKKDSNLYFKIFQVKNKINQYFKKVKSINSMVLFMHKMEKFTILKMVMKLNKILIFNLMPMIISIWENTKLLNIFIKFNQTKKNKEMIIKNISIHMMDFFTLKMANYLIQMMEKK